MRRSHSRQSHIGNTERHKAEKYTAENVIVFSPTSCTSSAKKEKAPADEKMHENVCNNKTKLNDTISKLLQKFDDIINDDLILIVIICLLLYERNVLKKKGASKNEISDYDYMIAALIYIFI